MCPVRAAKMGTMGAPVSAARRSGPSGTSPRAPNSVTLAAALLRRGPVDLQRHGAALAQVPRERERRERIVRRRGRRGGPASSVRRPGWRARARIALGALGDHHAQPVVARQQRPDALPPGGVRRGDDDPAPVGERVAEVQLPPHDGLGHAPARRARAEHLGQARGVVAEGAGDVELLAHRAPRALHTAQVLPDEAPPLAGERARDDPDDGRRGSNEPLRPRRAPARKAAPELTVEAERGDHRSLAIDDLG